MGTAFGQDSIACSPTSLLRAAWVLEDMHMHRIFIACSVLALALTTPVGAFAQDEPPATFKERYPAEPPLPQTPTQPANADKQQTTAMQHARVVRPRARIVVLRRSYLDAGTQVSPGERKFLDYAHPRPINRTKWSPISVGAWLA